MAYGVNIWTSGWRATGSNVSTPQYEMTIRVDWTDDTGALRTHTELVRFPNILAQVPAAWVADEMKDLLMRALRAKAGVDVSVMQAQVEIAAVVRGKVVTISRTFLLALLAKMAWLLDMMRDWLLTMRCKLEMN